MLARQALYQLSHLPSSSISVLEDTPLFMFIKGVSGVRFHGKQTEGEGKM